MGWVGVEGFAGGAPARLVGTTITAGRQPRAGESSAYARRRRHPVTHLYAKRSQQLCSWAGGPGGTPGHFPDHVPPAGRAGASSWAEARTGPYRPYVRGRKEKKTAGGWGPAKGRRRERDDERWPAAGGVRQGGQGAAGEASRVSPLRFSFSTTCSASKPR